MKSLIKIVPLLLICLFQFVSSMEERETVSTPLDCFEIFEDLCGEVQQIILVFYIEDFEDISENNFNTFDKINKSYQRIKKLSLVSKGFKLFEKDLMNSYRNRLQFLLAQPSQEDNMALFKLLVFNPSTHTIQDYNYQNILSWIRNAQPQILKAVLIFLRLQDTDTNEKDIVQKIWSRLKDRDTSLLHLACRAGNLELTKYLINPIVIAFFPIGFNEKDQNGHTPLMIACSCFKEKRKLEIIKLLLDASADATIKSTNKRRKTIKKLVAYGNAVEIPLENSPDHPTHYYTASDLAWKHKYFEAHQLIEIHLNKNCSNS